MGKLATGADRFELRLLLVAQRGIEDRRAESLTVSTACSIASSRLPAADSRAGGVNASSGSQVPLSMSAALALASFRSSKARALGVVRMHPLLDFSRRPIGRAGLCRCRSLARECASSLAARR